jgi:putative tryptophan/tyrosine transport system substrate-binding protein
MNRRHFLISLTAAAVRPGIAAAQSKVYRIGSLSPVMPFVPKSPFGALLSRGFTAAGYAIDGSLVLIPRGSNGQSELLPRLAQELADAKVDAILATGYPAAVAAKQTGLPTVVTHAVGDPVATGLIASLARPGGNVTGISDNATELLAKRLQILKQVAPGIKRVAMLWNKNDRAMVLRYEASAKAADVLGVSIQPLGVGEPDDFGGAFNAMESSMPDAILMVADSLTILNRKRVFDFAAARRLPAMYEYENLARDGGLLSYGPDFAECFARAASLADRILKGANPADLPFEQPTRYRLVINLKTANAMSLEIPPTLVASADEVIE